MTARLAACLAFAGLALAIAQVRAQPVAAPPASSPAASPSSTAPPTSPPAEQPTARDDRDSIDAGIKWLALVDSGKAGAAWDLASKQLQSAVTRDKFVAAIREVRKPLGKVEGRTAERFARAHQLPGVPEGDYVIIEYKVRFAKGKALQEQLVWAIEDGDIWRVAGYYYR